MQMVVDPHTIFGQHLVSLLLAPCSRQLYKHHMYSLLRVSSSPSLTIDLDKDDSLHLAPLASIAEYLVNFWYFDSFLPLAPRV